ncbi:hypothetical protein KEJ31_07635 [Candidatus Bathyarchaeota archaeon]|nr:hypothetical protein [Candidatus Bathyarchaeota archaeon]
MIYTILSPYTPEDSVKKMVNALRQVNAKIESLTDRSLRIKVKIGFMTSISVQVNFIEMPYGSIIRFVIPEEENLVDKVFFDEETAYMAQRERMERIKLKIEELKASVDGLNEEEVKRIFNINMNIKFLTRCPHCGSSLRKGFRCAYCNSIMVDFLY